MSAWCSREAIWAIWRSWASVAFVVDCVDGELVARRTLPWAGWEDIVNENRELAVLKWLSQMRDLDQELNQVGVSWYIFIGILG